MYVPTMSGVVCTHERQDLPFQYISVPAADAPKAAPKCYGNGVNGNRVQLVYAYAEGTPNRAGEIVPRILKEWTPYMEGTFRATSREQGREIGIRFHAPGCKLSVDVVKVSAAAADPTDGNFGPIVDAIYRQGYDKFSRKYLVWFDGPSGGPCGVGTALTLAVPPVGAFDNPTPINPNNFGQTPVLPSYALAYRSPTAIAGSTSNPCWGDGKMGALTESHELLHTLGAVQQSSPNATGFGHCRDENDIMCYPEGGVKTFLRCSSRLELLDCGQDDYFSARTTLTGYLATHWNIATSSFLGPALGYDEVTVELPIL
jgi:hypothetical protein